MDKQIRRLHLAATICLALAIMAAGFALWANQAGQSLQGPQAICALPKGDTWLSVDDELWQLGPNEALIRRANIAQLGLPGLPGNLVAAPDGRIALTVRGQARVYWLNPDTGHIDGQVEWQWPEEHRDLLAHPHAVAIGPQGEFAVATGGGHRVLAFTHEGRFIGITAPGTYRFTNGLWWDKDGIWTTDTNRFALLKLDPATLAVRQRVELSESSHPARYLSWMRPYPTSAGSLHALATVARMRNGMRLGRVVHVMADGAQHEVALPNDAQPQDLAWRGQELLVVDASSYQIKRSDLQGKALPDFGSSQVQGLLQDTRRHALRLTRSHQLGLITAGLSLLAALLLLGLKRLRQQAANRQTLAPAFKTLGTPTLSRLQLCKDALALHWPWLPLVAWMLAPRALDLWAQVGGESNHTRAMWHLAWMSMGLAVTAWAFIRRWRQAAYDPRFEGLLNVRAVSLLASDGAWTAYSEPGERLRETFMLGPIGTVRWMILTDRRLLSFRVTVRDKVMNGAWHRSDIESVALLALKDLHWWQRWLRQPVEGNWLKIRMRDGKVLQGMVPSAITARRVAAMLGLTARPIELDARAGRNARPLPPAQRWFPVLASALVPGCGQWTQGRNQSALLMFIIFAGWLAVGTGPVTLTWWTGSADISPQHMLQAWAMQVMWALFSAWDAWYLAGSSRRPRRG